MNQISAGCCGRGREKKNRKEVRDVQVRGEDGASIVGLEQAQNDRTWRPQRLEQSATSELHLSSS